jgi:uncharacterized linocin/CFP29 family protein
MDFILNGQGNGAIADKLIECGGDVGVLRPFIGEDGKQYCTRNENGIEVVVPMVGNTTTTMRKEDWIHLDEVILKAARPRLKAVADLRANGNVLNLPNGMAHTVLQTETQSRMNKASVSMDGMRENANDRPEFGLNSLPLPITHKDFNYSARNLMSSRNGGTALDTTSAEEAGRAVAEEAEQMLIGTSDYNGYNFGGGQIYGYTTFPSRQTKNFSEPDGTSDDGTVFITELNAALAQLRAVFQFGPYTLYTGVSWSQYLSADYNTAGGTGQTLAQRVLAIQEIENIVPLDYLTGFNLLIVQKTNNVVREVIGMDITTVQWDTHGGMQKNFKVMAIMVPQLRADFNGSTGILHGS